MQEYNLIYFFFSFILSSLFFRIYFDDSLNDYTVLIYSLFVALILYSLRRSIKLCGVILVILFIYIMKNSPRPKN
jgi:hypothetical protein